MTNVPMPNSIPSSWVCFKCESTWAWYVSRCAYCDPPKMYVGTVSSEKGGIRKQPEEQND